MADAVSTKVTAFNGSPEYMLTTQAARSTRQSAYVVRIFLSFFWISHLASGRYLSKKMHAEKMFMASADLGANLVAGGSNYCRVSYRVECPKGRFRPFGT